MIPPLLFLLLAPVPTPEEKAVAYLSAEVPRWERENHCFSCHNNGDGARVLYEALRRSFGIAPEVFSSTTAWLLRPAEWDNNHGNPGFSDKKLARIQFAASLAAAVESGAVRDRKPLLDAAQTLLPYQEADGHWQAGSEGVLGSPVTYGASLATYFARRTLQQADATRFREPIERAERWLLKAPANTVLDAAAVVLATRNRRPECIGLLLRSTTSEGGWGPYPSAPTEAFDTAIAMLALLSLPERSDIRAKVLAGREYLVKTQLPSGGWTETTRPSGAQSYAQHISTTAWVTQALIASASR